MIDPSDLSFNPLYADIAQEYVNYKRSQGFKFGNNAQKELIRLLSYIYKNNKNAEPLLVDEGLFNSYCFLNQDNVNPRTIHNKQSFFRQFTLYLKNIKNLDVYVLPEYSLISLDETFIPFILSDEQISALFKAADSLHYDPNSYKYNYLIFPALLRVLYCCGLRLHEALSLKLDNVDLVNGLLIIKHGKNNVSRVIPVSVSLQLYLNEYNHKMPQCREYFFPCEHGYMNDKTVRKLYHRSLKKAGIDGRASNGQIRVHDLRHNFAIHSLEKMISQGMDPYCSLPILSVYMGHKGIESTEIYLRLTKYYFMNMLGYSLKDAETIFPEVDIL